MAAEIEKLRAEVEQLKSGARKSAATKKKAARVAICSEQTIEDDFVSPIFPKGDGTRVLIGGAMAASSIFTNLTREQCEAVINAMYPAQRPAGKPIVVQGEPAQNYFVVDVGKCDVFVNRNEGAEELVLTIGSGASFGEIALMYECTNNITIKAHQDVTVWTIDRRTFRSIVVNSTSRKRRQYEAFLNSVPLFSKLTRAEKSLMADALQDVTFQDGDVLMKYGTEGDFFYICTQGKANVTNEQGDLLATRGEGEYFGERALLLSEPRNANIVATGTVQCARMDRDTFTRILGPLGDILQFREYDETGNEIDAAGGAEGSSGGAVAAAPQDPFHFEFAAEEGGQANVPMHRDLFDSGPVLGIGAFGYAQIVHYKKTGMTYAMKTLAKRSILKTDQLKHCHDEIENLRAAQNPFIVNLYSCFADDVNIYMVMEFVSGGELYNIIQRGKLNDDRTRFTGAEILMGLEYCHNKSVIYRDLKVRIPAAVANLEVIPAVC